MIIHKSDALSMTLIVRMIAARKDAADLGLDGRSLAGNPEHLHHRVVAADLTATAPAAAPFSLHHLYRLAAFAQLCWSCPPLKLITRS